MIINKFHKLHISFSLLMEYFNDYRIYNKYNASCMQDIRQHLEGKIIAHYHVLEKGFSHPIRKSCFSLPIVKSLINLINKYDNINAERTYQVEVAVNILKKYSLLSTNINCIPIELEKNIKAINLNKTIQVGSMDFSSDFLFRHALSSFSDFATSRFSVRNFTEKNVPLDIVLKAIKIAQKTPSVCNRQTCKVHILTNRNDINKHLSFQTGNRGYGHKIDKLLIVTSDMYLFEGPKERNQAFTDGGMFSMSLLYALHSLKIGAVTLNWAYDKQQNSSLHNLGVIPKNQKVIVFVGIGFPPAKFRVATSTRRDIKDIVNIV